MATSQELCLPSLDYRWAYNIFGLSPCQVASHLHRDNIWKLDPGGSYLTGLPATSGTCSSFFYALISACADCQSGQISTWEKWIETCIEANIPINPNGFGGQDIALKPLFIPLWAHLDTQLHPIFDATRARLEAQGRAQDGQRPGPGPNEGPPTPPTTNSSNPQEPSSNTTVLAPGTQTSTETSRNTGAATGSDTSRPPRTDTIAQVGTETPGRPGGNTSFPPITTTTSGSPAGYTTDHSDPSSTGPVNPGPVGATSSSTTNVAAIIGGVIAGLVLLLLIVILVLWVLRRRQRRRVAPSAAYLAASGSRPVMTMLQQPRRESADVQTPLFNDAADANSSIRFSHPLPHVFLDDVLTPFQSPPNSGTSTSFFTRSSRDGYQPVSG